MTYSIITPTDNADFFAQFKTFIVSAGWSIDAQSETEFYVNNGERYLAFRLANFYLNANTIYSAFTCIVNTGYDSLKDYFNQPGSSLNNLSALSTINVNNASYTKCMHAIYTQLSISEAVMIADNNNIVIRLKSSGSYYLDTMVITQLSKSHTFSGGEVLTSGGLIIGPSTNTGATSSDQWIFMQYNRTSVLNYPFACGAINQPPGLLSFYPVNQFITSFHKDSSWYVAGASNLSPIFFTNIIESSALTITKNAALYVLSDTVFSVGTSMYTGLNIIIRPEFFYKMDNDKFCYAGNIEKIGITTKTNLVDKQTLNYGGKDYLVLDFAAGSTLYPPQNYICNCFLVVEL